MNPSRLIKDIDAPAEVIRDARSGTLDTGSHDPLAGLRSDHEPTARSAFEMLYRDHYAVVWKFAYRFVGQRDAAQDLAQDLFLSIWDRRDTLRISTSVRAYLLSAVRLHALKSIRKLTTEQALTTRATLRDTDASGPPVGMGMELAPPDHAVESALLADRLERALAQLPERQRSAFLLRWELGLTNREIAQALGVGEAAISRLLTRAAETLRAIM